MATLRPRHHRFVESTLLSIVALLVPAFLSAQTRTQAAQSTDPGQSLVGHQGAAVRITVLDSNGSPLSRQALIKVHSVLQDTTNWQITGADSKTVFADQLFGTYEIEASSLGYLNGRTTLNIASMNNTLDATIRLQPDTTVGLESEANLPPHALHETNRAVRALRANDLKEPQKRLDEAAKAAPSSARVKYLQGYLYFVKGDLPQAQTLLEQATVINPRYGSAWSLLGRLHLMADRPKEAVTALEHAVDDDKQNWVAHDLLADAYLMQHEYGMAQKQADLAVETGAQDGTVAQLALAEALANLGKNQEAVSALKIFLKNHSKTIAAQHADELLRQLEHHKTKPIQMWPDFDQQVAAFDPANDLVIAAGSELPVVSWLPQDIDRVKHPVVTGLSCPVDQVLEGAGDRVQDLIANVEKISAIESILYEKLDPAGNAGASDTRKFDYIAAISRQPDVVLIDEYRSQRYDQESLPDRIADHGFAELALVFHPSMRDAFQMTCEGLGDWHGKPAWLVRFQQREDRPNHMQSYLLGDVAYPVSLKGRAWISADSFQVMRIESDMVRPMPQIQLFAEHMVADYAPVLFRKTGQEFWLPQTAEVYMYFRLQRYYHKHTFDKYMLFSVDAQDKVHEAKQDPDVPKSRNPRKHRFWPA
jgi:tetratricopeptide (TPR) repeat protein